MNPPELSLHLKYQFLNNSRHSPLTYTTTASIQCLNPLRPSVIIKFQQNFPYCSSLNCLQIEINAIKVRLFRFPARLDRVKIFRDLLCRVKVTPEPLFRLIKHPIYVTLWPKFI